MRQLLRQEAVVSVELRFERWEIPDDHKAQVWSRLWVPGTE